MEKDRTKAARACNACYETVFPLLDPPTGSSSTTFTTFDQRHTDVTGSQTMSTISGFPSWMTLTGQGVAPSATEALMAIDPGLPHVEDEGYGEGDVNSDKEGDVRHERL